MSVNPANIQELLIAISKPQQVDITTAQSSLLRLLKVNRELADIRPISEDDADDLGKGHEFPTQNFLTSHDVAGRLEKYTSSVWAAWAFGHALGSISEAAPNYTITPLDPVTDSIRLPYFTYVEQVRPGGSAVVDRAVVGCSVNRLQLNFRSGPGRASSTLAVDFIGCGKRTVPSGLSIPSATPEFLLPSASVTMSAVGTDYVTTERIIDAELVWENNWRDRQGYFPGSDFQTPGDATSGAIRGRNWFGKRVCSFRFNAFLESTSTEEASLLNGTTGTVVFTLSNGANHSLQVTLHDVVFSAVVIGDDEGLIKVEVTCKPLYDSSNGIITVVAETNVTGIGA